jgi:protein-tyrosine phosphatase/GNAT superfamily N-acetyltransferase
MTVIAKKPSACSGEELAIFKELVLAGGEVDEPGLDRRIKAAVCLVFHFADNEKVLGIGALKSPSDSYKKRVFTRSKSPCKPADFPFELGWLFIVEEYRGRGLSRKIAEEALKPAEGKNVFATTRVDNCPMSRTNARIGFNRSGNPYRTTRRGQSHLLALFVRRSLVDPALAPIVATVESPRDFYWVLSGIPALAGMRRPSLHTPWSSIGAAGFSQVVCLDKNCYDYDPAPLNKLLSVGLEDLIHGGPPKDPLQEEAVIRQVVETIVSKLRNGEGVVIHCWGGRGRTGTVIGCVLRTLGYRSDEVLNYLDSLHKSRGKAGWPESPWQAELMKRFIPGKVT